MPMKSRRKLTPIPFLTLALAAAVAFAPGAAHGQDIPISGTVTDTTDLVPPRVTVKAPIAADSGDVTFTAEPNQHSFSGLAPGTYEVTVSVPRFNAPGQVVTVAVGAPVPPRTGGGSSAEPMRGAVLVAVVAVALKRERR